MWVIFDLDGTLCDVSHRLHHILKKPKDWDAFNAACSQDELRRGEYELLISMSHDFSIALFTGRSEVERDATEDWLNRHMVPYDVLVMRREGDKRSDTIVKREYLERVGIPINKVLFVVEDRKSVVQMWRSLGLLCLQNCEGDF